MVIDPEGVGWECEQLVVWVGELVADCVVDMDELGECVALLAEAVIDSVGDVEVLGDSVTLAVVLEVVDIDRVREAERVMDGDILELLDSVVEEETDAEDKAVWVGIAVTDSDNVGGLEFS